MKKIRLTEIPIHQTTITSLCRVNEVCSMWVKLHPDMVLSHLGSFYDFSYPDCFHMVLIKKCVARMENSLWEFYGDKDDDLTQRQITEFLFEYARRLAYTSGRKNDFPVSQRLIGTDGKGVLKEVADYALVEALKITCKNDEIALEKFLHFLVDTGKESTLIDYIENIRRMITKTSGAYELIFREITECFNLISLEDRRTLSFNLNRLVRSLLGMPDSYEELYELGQNTFFDNYLN